MGSLLESPQEEDVGPPCPSPPTSSRPLHFVSGNYSQASGYSFILLPICWGQPVLLQEPISVTSDGPRLRVTQPHPTQEPLPPQPNTLGYSLGLPHPRTPMCKSEVMP